MELCLATGGHAPDTKIDRSTGAYLPFQGLTVVMHIRNKEQLRPLYEALSSDPEVLAGCAPLPLDSYHVTLKPIAERPRMQSDAAYNRRVQRIWPGLLALDQRLVDGFDQSRGVWMRVAAANVGSLRMEADAVTEALLRDWEADVVAQAEARQRPQRWHLTLSYWRNDRKRAQAAFERHAHLVPEILDLDAPRVCRYNSMEKFVPIQ